MSPVGPTAPVAPSAPSAPSEPAGPVAPVGPPLGPVAPVAPVAPTAPVAPGRPFLFQSNARSPALHLCEGFTTRIAPVRFVTQEWTFSLPPPCARAAVPNTAPITRTMAPIDTSRGTLACLPPTTAFLLR